MQCHDNVLKRIQNTWRARIRRKPHPTSEMFRIRLSSPIRYSSQQRKRAPAAKQTFSIRFRPDLRDAS